MDTFKPAQMLQNSTSPLNSDIIRQMVPIPEETPKPRLKQRRVPIDMPANVLKMQNSSSEHFPPGALYMRHQLVNHVEVP